MESVEYGFYDHRMQTDTRLVIESNNLDAPHPRNTLDAISDILLGTPQSPDYPTIIRQMCAIDDAAVIREIMISLALPFDLMKRYRVSNQPLFDAAAAFHGDWWYPIFSIMLNSLISQLLSIGFFPKSRSPLNMLWLSSRMLIFGMHIMCLSGFLKWYLEFIVDDETFFGNKYYQLKLLSIAGYSTTWITIAIIVDQCLLARTVSLMSRVPVYFIITLVGIFQYINRRFDVSEVAINMDRVSETGGRCILVFGIIVLMMIHCSLYFIGCA